MLVLLSGRVVSTHASAREATDMEGVHQCDAAVSTHASAREATRSRTPHRTGYLSFYPRLREGGDGRSRA